MYFLVKWLCTAIVRSFFYDLTVINGERIPLYGPVIFVGNHNNQFMDASMLIALLPRRVRFLVAEKSMRRKLIGNIARVAGCIPVRRQADLTYAGIGALLWTPVNASMVAAASGGGEEEEQVGVAEEEEEEEGRSPEVELMENEDASVGEIRMRMRGEDIGTNTKMSKSSGGSRSQCDDSAATGRSGGSRSQCDDSAATGRSGGGGWERSEEQSPQMEEGGTFEGMTILGGGTRFTIDVRVGYRVFIDVTDSNQIAVTVRTVRSDTEMVVNEPIGAACPPEGAAFTIQPKVDQTEVYDAVSDSLKDGDTIGIFPEGGSHDRTTLLPLKPGVAVMALCSVLEGAEDVMILPVGLAYHQVDRFQSRATINIGMPIPITEEMAQAYQQDRRAATGKLLTQVEEGLRNCTLTAEDYDTMDCVKLCSGLFPPERLRVSQDRHHALHLRFATLFWRFGSHPKLVELKSVLNTYKRHLREYSILDDEVWHLKQSTAGATLSLVEKCGAIALAAVLGLPLAILWGPLRLIAYWKAERHRVVALAGSRVKIRATDVLASYKILVLMVLLPTFNIFYGMVFGLFFFSTYVEVLYSIALATCLLPFLFYVSLQYADKLIPLFRQIKTQVYVINGKINIWRDTERELITHRIEAQLMVRSIVDEFGPIISPTFIESFYQFIPKVVLESDTKRLRQKKDEWSPIVIQKCLDNREEIL
eukprot:GHVS01037334.1.p1 GENE.GHVS01037334.1~~GHVS01037334.1.p1  ORF type:complete len:704 (-),score=108.84 GHVS01037334.1:461-2572(-)